MKTAIAILTGLTALSPVLPAAASATGHASAAQAVMARDRAWAQAEQRGDVAAVDDLLLPGYRSVDSEGRVSDKAAILANTRRNAGSDAMARRVAEWNARHPTEMRVEIEGRTAILTFISTAPGSAEPIMSCDVFVLDRGRWRAFYSQHTKAEG